MTAHAPGYCVSSSVLTGSGAAVVTTVPVVVPLAEVAPVMVPIVPV